MCVRYRNYVMIRKQLKMRKALIEYNRIGAAKIEEADDLTVISGIGGWIKEKLINRLTTSDIEIIAEVLDISPDSIDKHKWIHQASKLVNSHMATTMFTKN
jgi:predicted flap endonuclease-1-like 5' DNA nuclease